jgi:hypothetical protein
VSFAAPDFHVERQPDDRACGPTCLHAVYNYFGDAVPLSSVLDEVSRLEHGGTYAPLLGVHALQRGYSATIHTCDLELFDPTWFEDGVDLAARLREQLTHKRRTGLRAATDAYLRFIELGGRVRLQPLDVEVLRRHLRRGLPVLTGVSATFLYWCSRERPEGSTQMVYDDVRGEPTGHFVVVFGYDPDTREMWLADPLHDNPLTGERTYAVDAGRLLSAILLGAPTYDASLLVVEPPEERRP